VPPIVVLVTAVVPVVDADGVLVVTELLPSATEFATFAVDVAPTAVAFAAVALAANPSAVPLV